MSNENTPQDECHRPAVGVPVERMVRHAAPKRDRLALWSNLVIAHTWGVACWIRPGWFPAAVLLVAITLTALILYEDKITAAIAVRANDEHA